MENRITNRFSADPVVSRFPNNCDELKIQREKNICDMAPKVIQTSVSKKKKLTTRNDLSRTAWNIEWFYSKYKRCKNKKVTSAPSVTSVCCRLTLLSNESVIRFSLMLPRQDIHSVIKCKSILVIFQCYTFFKLPQIDGNLKITVYFVEHKTPQR